MNPFLSTPPGPGPAAYQLRSRTVPRREVDRPAAETETAMGSETESGSGTESDSDTDSDTDSDLADRDDPRRVLRALRRDGPAVRLFARALATDAFAVPVQSWERGGLLASIPSWPQFAGYLRQFRRADPEAQQRFADMLAGGDRDQDPDACPLLAAVLRAPRARLPTIFRRWLQLQEGGGAPDPKLREWLELAVRLPDAVSPSASKPAVTLLLARARAELDRAVYGQEAAKRTILECLAANLAGPPGQAPTPLLLASVQPGTGKTTLVQALARALDWPFRTLALSGSTDASVLRGHSYTYEGAQPGAIVQSMIEARSARGLFLLDEVDKLSANGAVQQFLLHLVDPATHRTFEDHYFQGLPVDLSGLWFCFTANDVGRLHRALLDRLRVVTLRPYGAAERATILRTHLWPRCVRALGWAEGDVLFPASLARPFVDACGGSDQGLRPLAAALTRLAQALNLRRLEEEGDGDNHPLLTFPLVLTPELVRDLVPRRGDHDDDEEGHGYASMYL